MKKLTKVQETFAESIGATHFYMEHYWKNGGLDEAGQSCPLRWDGMFGWVPEPAYQDIDDPHTDWILSKIDYSGVEGFSWVDFQLAVERLVKYCDDVGIICDEMDTVERMLKAL